MGAKSQIEWTDATWTPLRARVRQNAKQIAKAKGYTSLLKVIHPGKVGPHCEHASPGCFNCYSETNNGRCLPNNGTGLPFDRRARDLVDIFIDENILQQPTRWRPKKDGSPRKIFVCSQTDLFGEWVADEQIDSAFAIMVLAPQHIFQVLTKHAQRMRDYFQAGPAALAQRWSNCEWLSDEASCAISNYIHGWSRYRDLPEDGNPLNGTVSRWPLPNVWFGVSAEDRERWLERVPLLRQVPAAVRFVSYEPALASLGDVEGTLNCGCGDYKKQHENGVGRCRMPNDLTHGGKPCLSYRGIDWVIAGGESGPGARPIHPDWVRSLRDQCVRAGVAFFFKQWGEWHPHVVHGSAVAQTFDPPLPLNRLIRAWKGDVLATEKIDWSEPDGTVLAARVGKKSAGALLDGREWREFPQTGARS